MTTLDEQLTALPDPVKTELVSLVRVLGGLSQEEKAGLCLALHRAGQAQQAEWMRDFYGALNRLTATLTGAAFPSAEKLRRMWAAVHGKAGDSDV